MDYNELRSQMSALLERFADENRCSLNCEVSVDRIVVEMDNISDKSTVSVRYKTHLKLEMF